MTRVARQPLIRQDIPSCSLAQLHQLDAERYPFFLESSAQADTVDADIAAQQARFDLLFGFPQGNITLRDDMVVESDSFAVIRNDFIATLNQVWQQAARQAGISPSDTLASFTGWFGYFSYEFARVVEPTLAIPLIDNGILARLTRIPLVLVKDKQKDTCYLICEAAYEELIPDVLHDIDNLAAFRRHNSSTSITGLHEIVEDAPQGYLDGIDRIKRYIYEGDIFQVNFSRQWQARTALTTSAFDLYAALKSTNPAPFSGSVHFEEFDIISSSPERLVRVAQRHVSTRPIAGTRPRSGNNRAILEELIGHPKERAEHIMLIDLERNDLGRVCKPGTVKVTDLMSLESFAHVHHIVSGICGELRDTILPGDVINAVFPGGTITGCPKVRCMEIIAELEQQPRGAYTGSIGYIGHNGNMDFNILIRTLVKTANRITFRAGAGIVHDSQPEMELAETRAKAKGLLLSLGGAGH